MKSACCAGVLVVAVVIVSVLAGWNGGLRAAAEPAAGSAVNAPKEAGGPRIGESCTVYLRGDATGAAYHDRIPDLGNLISLRGTVVSAEGTWLQLRDGDKVYRIPQASIFVVESDGRAKGK